LTGLGAAVSPPESLTEGLLSAIFHIVENRFRYTIKGEPVNDTTPSTAAASCLDFSFTNIDCDPDLLRPLPRTRRATPTWVLSASRALAGAVSTRVAAGRKA
jgi:hypothetical protein